MLLKTAHLDKERWCRVSVPKAGRVVVRTKQHSQHETVV